MTAPRWTRTDLRLSNGPALRAALADLSGRPGGHVLPPAGDPARDGARSRRRVVRPAGPPEAPGPSDA